MDLYELGTGFKNQLHDFNPGIAPNGLFWTVRIPDDALTLNGQTARLQLDDLPVVDSFTFLGPVEVPGLVSMDITFAGSDRTFNISPGSDDPTDPTNFAGEFRPAVATGSFSGSNDDGFTFAGEATSEPIWGEMGTERNGFFLH